MDRIPEDPVRDHPAIGQVDIASELDCDQFVVHLNDNSPDPTPDPVIVFLVVAKSFDIITDVEGVFYSR